MKNTGLIFLFDLVVLTTMSLGSHLGMISLVLLLLISFPVYAKSGIATQCEPQNYKKNTIASYVNDTPPPHICVQMWKSYHVPL